MIKTALLFLFPEVLCVVSLYTWIQENGCIIKEKTPTPFRNYRPSAKGLHLIDTFFCLHWRETGKVFDTVLFRVLPGMDDKRTLLWYQKTLGKNKTSALYKPKTIFNKNNCPIICDIYRKSLSLSIENKEINKPLKLVWLPV